MIVRFFSERQDNKKLLDLQDLSDNEFTQILKNYFEHQGIKVIREKENDLILEKGEEKIIVRHKRYQNLINASQIRAFRHSINQSHADKGYFVTTSDFTHPCLNEIEDRQIELINGKKLLKILGNQKLKEIKDG